MLRLVNSGLCLRLTLMSGFIYSFYHWKHQEGMQKSARFSEGKVMSDNAKTVSPRSTLSNTMHTGNCTV